MHDIGLLLSCIRNGYLHIEAMRRDVSLPFHPSALRRHLQFHLRYGSAALLLAALGGNEDSPLTNSNTEEVDLEGTGEGEGEGWIEMHMRTWPSLRTLQLRLEAILEQVTQGLPPGHFCKVRAVAASLLPTESESDYGNASRQDGEQEEQDEEGEMEGEEQEANWWKGGKISMQEIIAQYIKSRPECESIPGPGSECLTSRASSRSLSDPRGGQILPTARISSGPTGSREGVNGDTALDNSSTAKASGSSTDPDVAVFSMPVEIVVDRRRKEFREAIGRKRKNIDAIDSSASFSFLDESAEPTGRSDIVDSCTGSEEGTPGLTFGADEHSQKFMERIRHLIKIRRVSVDED